MSRLGPTWIRALLLAALVGGMSVAVAAVGTFSSVSACCPGHPTPTPPPPLPAGVPWRIITVNLPSVCYFFPQASSDTNYFGVMLQGTWKQPLTTNVTGLPPGSSFLVYTDPIPPGSSGSGTVLGTQLAITLPSTTPLGTHTVSVTETDGTRTSTFPIDLVVQSRCGRY